MLEAIADAATALESGDVPVAAFVLDVDGNRLGQGRNERELTVDPTAQAEIIAISQAA